MSVVMMAKFVTGLSLIFILSAVSVNAVDNSSRISGFFLNTIQGDGYEIRASSNSRKFNIITPDSLVLQVTIGQNGFLVTGNDQGVPLNANWRRNHRDQVEFSNEATGQQPCESQKLPKGYRVTIGMGAYKYHTLRQNWNDARQTCADEGGHLLVITSDAEEKLILEQIRAAKWEDTWLGIHDLFSLGEWVTVQNVPLNKTGWATWTPMFIPNPDNYEGRQHCLRLLQQSGMDDIECDYLKKFVCKIPCDYSSAAHGLNGASVH